MENENKTPRPVGRPRRTLNDLPEDWRETYVMIGQEGGSCVEACVMIGVSRSAYETLMKDYPEFRVAEQERHMLSQVWWEKTGRKITKDGGGSAKCFEFNMTNRFREQGYSLRKELDHKSSDGSMSPKSSAQVTIDTSKLTTEQLAAIYGAIRVTTIDPDQ